MGATSGRRVASFRGSVAELPLVISSEFYRHQVLVIGTFCIYIYTHKKIVLTKSELTINRHGYGRNGVPQSNYSLDSV